MNKFLIINPFGIGDVLFTTPVISSIKANYPDCFIGYWCNERVKDIFKNDSNIDRVFALSRGDIKNIYKNSKLEGINRSFKLFSGIKKERFNIALDFSLDHRYGLISMLAGINRRIGFNYKNRGRFLTDKIDIDGYSDKHVAEYYLDLLGFLDIKQKNRSLYLSVSKAGELKAKAILQQADINDNDLIIGISPGAGASWGIDASLKHWPAKSYAQLADRLITDFKAKVLILGDAKERSIADIIINTMENKAIDLAGKISLEEFVALIANLRLLITNDGGPLHIAVALGKKTISFFGPVSPKVYGPYPADENRHIVLRRSLDCSPCYANFHLRKCARNKECLESINIEQALEAAKRLLN